ncbi:ash family protein [Endozoicomonas sp. 4G]|uniref:ash family protein n=1 Tax=Endozoicomonas sp. 4G TaxID=2872754 RepID=UPI002078705A|nr:ash family protein [Endozoicomonas sp. 4G]
MKKNKVGQAVAKCYEGHKEGQRPTHVQQGLTRYEQHKEQQQVDSLNSSDLMSLPIVQKAYLPNFSDVSSLPVVQKQGCYSGITLCVNNSLPDGNECAIVHSVTAKSVTRTITPVILKAQQSPAERLFCCLLQRTYRFMVGLMGLPSGRPVSFSAGGDNPISSATNSDLSPWVAGSKTKGGHPMAITCRLALLKGSSHRLCDRRVRGYITLSFNSHQQARKEARKLDAVVCGWRVSA